MGVVKVQGTTDAEYQIQQGEIVWTNFVFMDDSSFTFDGLNKTRDGVPAIAAGYGEIDYGSENQMHQHLTAPTPYIMVNADRDWIRVD